MIKAQEPEEYGKVVPPETKANGKITLLTSSPLYKSYTGLKAGEKAVFTALLRFMTDGLNTIHIGGETLQAISKDTGFTPPSIRNAVTALKRAGLIEPTTLSGEYVINPILVEKASYYGVWISYQKIETQKRQHAGKADFRINPSISQ